MNLLHDNVFAIALAIAKQCFKWVFFRFAKIGSLLREPILRIMTIKTAHHRVFKMATGCSKWLPTVLRDGFLAIQAPKMATVWRIFTRL